MSSTPLESRVVPPESTTRFLRRLRPSRDWLWWLPTVFGGLYLLAILTHLRTILDSVWLSSDSDIDAVLAHLSLHAPAGTVFTTGDYPHYETFAFALLTRSWPLYREIWVLAPPFFAALGFAAVLWSTMRAFGRWPAAVVGSALVCFGGGGIATRLAGGLATVFAFDAHANTLITAAVVGAALVWTVPRIAELSGRRLVVVALGIGILGGLPLAGDTLYLAWGVAPLILVCGLAAWRGPVDGAGRVIAFGLGALAATFVTSFLFAAFMRAQGVHGFSPSYNKYLTFTTPGGLIRNLGTLVRALPSLTAGSFFGRAVNWRSALALLSASLLFAALVSAVWSVRRRVANALPRAAGGGDVVGPRFVHTTFWITVLIAGVTVFLLGSPNPWTTDGRYLLGPYVAVGALLPLMLERGLGWRLLVTAGVSLFALSALLQFGSGVRAMSARFQSARTARTVAAFARKEHVAVAYGYYWNSIDLMWESDFRVDVYPVQRCLHQPRRLCTFSEISMSNWDRPHGHVRSMVVINPHARQVRRVQKSFGHPLAVGRAGGLWLYVYPYDIATKLGQERGLTL